MRRSYARPGRVPRPPHTEGRAANPLRRIELDPAAMSFDETFAQRESDAGVIRHAGGQRVKHSKHSFLKRRRDTGPVVGNRQYAVLTDVLRQDGDVSAKAIVVLDRIADEIAQHAFERRLVRDERGRIDLDRNIKSRLTLD